MPNGWNFTDGVPRTLTWTSYNKPKTLSESGTTLTFSYGADRDRFKQVNSTGSGTTTLYIGNLYEKVTAGTQTTHVHYIYAGGSRIAIYKVPGSGTPVTRYLHQDHLGSVTEISSDSGTLLEELSYDAHGKRREPDWQQAMQQLFSEETPRGFTDHEMLDDVSLIHMTKSPGAILNSGA